MYSNVDRTGHRWGQHAVLAETMALGCSFLFPRSDHPLDTCLLLSYMLCQSSVGEADGAVGIARALAPPSGVATYVFVAAV